MRSRIPRPALIAVACLVAACGSTPRHTNTLIFGTNTKIAFDVGPDPTGVTSVTLGYKRQEAVWMPLLANKGRFTDQDSQASDCQGADCMFRGEDGKDAYSVLASFGANFSGEGQAGGTKGAAGIAQYFATGLAARELAKAGGAQLVSVQPEGFVQQKARELISQEDRAVEKILGHLNENGNVNDAKLRALVQGSGLDDSWITSFSGQPVSKLRDELTKGPTRTMSVDLAKKIKEN